jgi:hypothetical protein
MRKNIPTTFWRIASFCVYLFWEFHNIPYA